MFIVVWTSIYFFNSDNDVEDFLQYNKLNQLVYLGMF